MKEGEEEKTKSYSALIWTEKVIQKEDITFLDSVKVACLGWYLSFVCSLLNPLQDFTSPMFNFIKCKMKITLPFFLMGDHRIHVVALSVIFSEA